MAQSLEDARRRSTRPASGARVPPHNLEAEESLLGAMLLSRDAIVSAVEIQLTAADFYKPSHGHVFDAVTSIYAQGEPADPVTVADELQRAGLLDQVGGSAALVSLQANTPAIGNAARYARIVEEHALLRKLIGVAGHIADMGYSTPDDVAAAIDEAEALVFDVAQRRVTDSMASIRDLLERHLDHIEALYERGDDITGVPTGFIDLDQQLAGLQPSNLVIVGGRPGTGKALALETPIATPRGWTTMGSLREGDEVFDECGRPCRVTRTTEVMTNHPCYEVTFDDGSSLVADADHQWFAHAEGRPAGVVTTRHMVLEERRWFVPVAAALDLPRRRLREDPYELGRRLGTATRSGNVSPAYLRSSFKQRLTVLEGLLDAAGSSDGPGVQVLCLRSRRAARQAHELVCSLGYKPGPIEERVVPLVRGRGRSWQFRWVTLDSGTGASRAIVSIRPVRSVPVRCIAVDSPSHLYLAGRSLIPTHNTSFALGIVSNAALESRTPVLLFSLEMSHLELTQRMLCAEARVDATRMRNGRLLESDWPKIAHATGRLAEAPIYIDDNPHLTVMEIRAKARRLKSRAGLGLIVIDYLQLMTGRNSAENRQVEVSEISRGLKILARELECPVIALSQLSRNLETRADKRPVLADLRESGCMPASTRVMRADTGEEITLGELVLSQSKPLVWSVDTRQRLVPRRLTRAFGSGVRPVFRLRLASGYEVDATANHPFLTVDGWVPLGSLAGGSFIAVPRQVPPPVGAGDTKWSRDELAFLAHLLGEGTLGPGAKYATGDDCNRDVVVELAHRLFRIRATVARNANTWQVAFPSPYRLTHNKVHPVRIWLEPHGLWMSRAWNKFVPESVFGSATDDLAWFLHHLWSTDGSITIGRSSRGDIVRTYYATTSLCLARDVKRLLLRFGIRSTIGTAKKRRSGRPQDGQHYRAAYSVIIQGAAQQVRFLERIGSYGARGNCVPRALEILRGVKENPEHRPRRFSRDRLATKAQTIDSQEIDDSARSDLFWEEVVSIEPLGDQPTFDVTIEDDHNFIANGIVAHNSLEQDADVVIFLYRDEVYNRDSPDRGTAEVIVAKHRNGPTGMTQLAFLDHYTRFANMARGV